MLGLFRTNQLLGSIYLIPYLGLLFAANWFYPMAEWEGVHWEGGVLFEYLKAYFPAPGPWSWALIIFLLFLLGAGSNYLEMYYRLGRDVSLLPGVFVVLVSAFHPLFRTNTPFHWANLFLLIALFQAMGIYKKVRCADQIFNIGLFVGIASFFVPVYLIFFLFGWVSLSIMRSFNIKERLMMLSGLITPYLLGATITFWFDRLPWFLKRQFINGFSFFPFPDLSPIEWATTSLFGLIILLLVLFSGNYYKKRVVQDRKHLQLLFWLIPTALLCLLFLPQASITNLLVLSLPLGVLTGLGFQPISRPLAEILHVFLLLLLAGIYFLPLLLQGLS